MKNWKTEVGIIFLTQMINKTFEGDEEIKRRQLLEYCKLDTEAMVEILKKLESVINWTFVRSNRGYSIKDYNY